MLVITPEEEERKTVKCHFAGIGYFLWLGKGNLLNCVILRGVAESPNTDANTAFGFGS